MIEATIIGEREILAGLADLQPKIRLRVAKAMRTAIARMQAYVKGAKLSGQVLHVRTGNLRRSIGTDFVETGTEMTGKVGVFSGPTLPYGRAHEYGFDGEVNVKEHLRRTKSGSSTVRAHTRHMHLPERSFLRTTLAELGPGAVALIEQAVAEAARA